MSKESYPAVVLSSNEDKEFLQKLSKQGLVVFVEPLPTGDILIGDILIERKRIEDLWKSVLDKRLDEQRERLRKLANEFKPYILIEGKWNSYIGILKRARKKYEGFDWQATKQRLLSVYRGIATDPEIGHFRTDCMTETCELVKNLALQRPHDPDKLRALRESPGKELTLSEWQRYILEGFPNIGPTKANRILQEKYSLGEVFTLLIYGDQDYPPEPTRDLKPNTKTWDKIQEILWTTYGEEE